MKNKNARAAVIWDSRPTYFLRCGLGQGGGAPRSADRSSGKVYGSRQIAEGV